MTEPTPIKDGIVPALDIEHELMDFLKVELIKFKKDAGQPPTRIAVAVMGKGNDGRFYTRCNTWDTKEETCRTENCGLAATLFLQRAIGDD